MKIRGIDHLSTEQINLELQQGAKFVIFPFCVSIIVMTFKRSSNIHFVTASDSSLGKSAPFWLTSLLLGWWGFPWGPIWTVSTLFRTLRGGIDVTDEVLASMNMKPMPAAPGAVAR